jgi:hypothetical protein
MKREHHGNRQRADSIQRRKARLEINRLKMWLH